VFRAGDASVNNAVDESAASGGSLRGVRTDIGDLAIGACVGGAMTVVWFASEPLQGAERTPLLWVPVIALAGLLILGRLRGQYGAAKGYLVGAWPIVAFPALFYAGVATVKAGAMVYEFRQHLNRKRFVAADWRMNRKDDERSRMTEDLMERHWLQGLAIGDARALLGLPDTNLGGSECDLAYWLDKDRGWLCLSASEGRISSVRLHPYRD
jgi:hypothetical protein